jgi:chemotaxis protein methyltransferase CheR
MTARPSPARPAAAKARAVPAVPRLSDGDFQRVAERVRRTAGIVLGAHRRDRVRARLEQRMAALGLTRVRAYLDHLDGPEGAGEWANFISAVTTNLTAFFREGHHFVHFDHCLGDPNELGRRDSLRIWSAGCSSGEEAYSVAMVLREHALRRGGCDVQVLATDIDTIMLERARSATYPLSALNDLPSRFRRPEFVRRDETSLTVVEEVRRVVHLRPLNLIDPWPMRGPFDAIFCRNVLIYFDAAAKAAMIDGFAAVLRPGGLLYLGHSESLLGSHPSLAGEGQTTYRRVGS